MADPITGITGCCSRATTGHAAAAPPTSVMNSRRLFDHLVGKREERLRHSETKRLAVVRLRTHPNFV